MIRIAHTGDWHLRPSQYHYRSRGDDFRKAAKDTIELALHHGANIIVNTGDYFDSPQPNSANVADMLWMDRYLRNQKTPMLTIQGNHEWAEPSWISLVHALHEDDWDETEGGIIPMDNQHWTHHSARLSVFALPWCGPEEFRQRIKDAPEADILLWHGLVSDFVGYPVENAVSLEDFPEGKYKLILLGDIHNPEIKHLKDGTPVAYPGSTEMCSASEPLEKGFYMWTIDDNGKPAKVDRIQTWSRPKAMFTLEDQEGLDAALQQVQGMEKDEMLCYLNYTADVAHAPAAFRAVLGERAILKPTLRFKDADKFMQHKTLYPLAGGETLSTLQNYVGEVLHTEHELFDITFALADPEQDPKELIEQMVAKLNKEEAA